MYLSRVELNTYRRETARLMSSPQTMHATVMASFPSFSDPGRVLWRVDTLGPSTYVIVQSAAKPDFNHVVDQFGWPSSGQSWDTLDYDGFLGGIRNGQIWRFRLAANPVHSVSDGSMDGKRGKVMAHVTADQRKKWLIDRSPGMGFRIVDASPDAGEPALEIRDGEMKRFSRGDGRVTFSAVTFEGVLSVEDAEKLVSSMKGGIGRSKAYGCGLITLARP